MKRREFLTLLGGAVAAWPLETTAQQPAKLPTIGFLGADASAFSAWTTAFVGHLRELGWVENRNVAIEFRWSEGRTERYAEIATEFVRLKVDVIVTVGSAVPTVRQATSTIPIVFAVAIDPVGIVLVESLAKPGGNVTGLSLQAANLAGKRSTKYWGAPSSPISRSSFRPNWSSSSTSRLPGRSGFTCHPHYSSAPTR